VQAPILAADMTHLLATISSHGLGHLAQSAPVLNALRRRVPGLQLTVASTVPAERLRARIEGEFRVEARPLDFGFEMEDAFRVARGASAEAYRALHARWDDQVADTTSWLEHEQPDLVLANVAYLPLAAAARLGITAFGMSSLNWADLFAHVFAGEPWMSPLHSQMLDAYRSATVFIKLTPGMSMPDLPNGRWAGPVARLGTRRRDELRVRCGAEAADRIVLVAFGGIDARLPMEDWSFAPRLHWLVPGAWRIEHPRVSAIESLGWDFSDLIASADAVIGKPGYGTFVEAACNGTPMLYAARPGWPEQDALIPWLHKHARARQVGAQALRSGALAGELEALWQQPAPMPAAPSGADEVAALLAGACAAL
jgi:UDP:flavonoid glycosyltransferase YjiC (YdhE family)